ncbi:MAG: hypothetical protein NTNFB02_25800 [Nitrospira sp.]
MQERKAANVLPEPVGAAIKAWCPDWMAGHASVWTSVGTPTDVANQRAMRGWKRDSGMEC